jgi:hypothetical protein
MMPHMKWITGVFVSFILAGCGGGDSLIQAPQPEPRAYQQLAADYGETLAPKSLRFSLAGASISAMQPTRGPQPGAWYACVKAVDGTHYAVLYRDGKVADFRQAVAIDNCAAMEGYQPLPPAKPTAAKPDSLR